MLAVATAGAADPHPYPLQVAAGSRLLLAAKINGRPVDALLDSAAETTLLDWQFAAALHLSHGQTVAVVDLSDVGRRLLHRRIDAILGREIFDAARLTIDIDERQISVARGGDAPRGVKLDLVSEHGIETIPVRVENGPAVRATLDLGNGADVLISKAYAERMRFITDGRVVASNSGGGLGGKTVRQIVTLQSIDIAGRRFESVRAAVDPQPSASDVNIGVKILRHFRITTDFKERAVWLDPR